MNTDTTSLIDAAAQLGLSYGQVLRLVLVGTLKGEKREGHWQVSQKDLARFIRSRRSDSQ